MFADDEPDPRDPVTPEHERASWLGAACMLVVMALFAAAFLLALAGCCPGSVKASEVAPLAEHVIQRHQDYVGGDSRLTPAQRSAYVRSGEILRDTLRAAVEAGGGQ